MARNSLQMTVPARRPRNALVRALIDLGKGLTTRQHRSTQAQRRQQLDRRDLDQRVREIGEW
jgi:hypothetical protein